MLLNAVCAPAGVPGILAAGTATHANTMARQPAAHAHLRSGARDPAPLPIRVPWSRPCPLSLSCHVYRPPRIWATEAPSLALTLCVLPVVCPLGSLGGSRWTIGAVRGTQAPSLRCPQGRLCPVPPTPRAPCTCAMQEARRAPGLRRVPTCTASGSLPWPGFPGHTGRRGQRTSNTSEATASRERCPATTDWGRPAGSRRGGRPPAA